MGSLEDKKIPLSVEDLLRKKKEQEQALKPKFLTKEERAAIALKKREEEVEAIKKKREELINATKANYNGERDNGISNNDKKEKERERDRDREKGRDRGRERDRDRGRDRDRDRDQRRYRNRSNERYREKESRRDTENSRIRDKETKSSSKNDIFSERAKELELKAIRDRYMGSNLEQQRKIRKVNERKFVFDWDAAEDTSKDHNPLYTQRHQAQLFGRGKFAGIDESEQLKESSRFYDTILDKRRTEDEKLRASELAAAIRAKESKPIGGDSLHWSQKALEDMKERDWRIFREDFNITIKGSNIPKPIRNWDEAKLPSKIKEVIKKIGYKEPTPIQRQAIPIGLQNRDIIGIAETGSGKTASFVIPMLVFISTLPSLKNNIELQEKGPYAVILAPTRELAQQIEQETKKFAEPIGCKCISIIGGHSLTEQAFNLREGAEIVIATPGRLKECLEKKVIVFTQCTYLVMDEADRMIDMGFESEVNYILDAFPVNNMRPETAPFDQVVELDENNNPIRGVQSQVKIYRQTTMFSATMPPQVERIARKFMRLPATVIIGNAGQAVESVEQIVEMISEDSRKRTRMLEILDQGYDPPIIIFVNQIKTCDRISSDLSKEGYRCVILHGRKSQDQRESALEQLKSGAADILVATDVAARGIDVKDVSLVINYDMAGTIESYTHRIGRTGRAGKSGTAVTFLSKDDTEVYYDLKAMLVKSKAKIPPELMYHEAAKFKPNNGFKPNVF